MNYYENSWTIPGVIGKNFLNEAVTIQWAQTKHDNPQSFETTYKNKKITLDWYKSDRGPDYDDTGAHMHIKGSGAPAKEVAQLVAKHFAGQRIITLNGKVFSTKVAGFKNRAPDDYTTYRPGWKKDWTFTA